MPEDVSTVGNLNLMLVLWGFEKYQWWFSGLTNKNNKGWFIGETAELKVLLFGRFCYINQFIERYEHHHQWFRSPPSSIWTYLDHFHQFNIMWDARIRNHRNVGTSHAPAPRKARKKSSSKRESAAKGQAIGMSTARFILRQHALRAPVSP